MRLSVIIPAYNVENYIEAALDSVFAQATQPHEVIVVDDGSTDATADRVIHHPRAAGITLLSTTNRGPGPARNEGLRRATGDYVYFFDGDDLLDATFLATITSTVQEANEPDIVLFSGVSFQDKDMPGKHSRNLMRPFAARDLGGNEAIARLVDAGTPIPMVWLLVSKRCLWVDNAISFKAVLHEDDEVFLRLVLAAARVTVLQDVLIHQRIRAMSIMTSEKTAKHAAGLIAAASTLTTLYEVSEARPTQTRRAIRKRAVRTSRRYLRLCRKIGTKPDAAEVLRQALRLRSPGLAVRALARVLI